MWKYKLTFKAIADTLSFFVESESKELIEEFVYGFFEFFGDTETKKIKSHHINDDATKKKVIEFIKKFRGRFPPSLNQVIAFFDRLEDNESFLFLPGIDLTIDINYRLHNYLVSLKSNESLETLNANFEKVYGNALKNYDILPNGTVRKFIGIKNLYARKCRFCGLGYLETEFKQTAHAISEGLGNKKVFLYEECDSCNEKFSRELEPDLINYFSIFRTFFDIKGKGGSKKLKGKEFKITNDGQPIINFSSERHRPDPGDKSYILNLELLDKVNTQDIYRCLSKFVLSVIDTKYIVSFKETIKWINKEISIDTLPKIGELISYNHFTKEPKLFVYIRKTDNMDFPFMVGEFHFTCKIITFIIPFSNKDDQTFIDKIGYQTFWKQFVHYNKPQNWAFNDFSNDTERDLKFNLDFQLPK
jgi:hypothetical protein